MIYTTTEVDKSNILDFYYTYADPKTSATGRNNGMALPKPSDKYTSYVMDAQIHTHGAYFVDYYTDAAGNFIRTNAENGFSTSDIDFIKKKKYKDVNTYAITPFGDMFKATYETGYTDGGSPYMTGFARDDTNIKLMSGWQYQDWLEWKKGKK